MRIARILSPVHSLGPGNRVCLWTQGCSKHCLGCIAPELQPHSGADVPEELLSKLLLDAAVRNNCNALTISGGDPLEQGRAMLQLLQKVRPKFKDILVYTGYRLEEVQAGSAGEEARLSLQYIDVLIDGRYEMARNHHDCVLRGSDNQVIHFFSPDLKSLYDSYMEEGRILETFQHNSNIIITGIQDEE